MFVFTLCVPVFCSGAEQAEEIYSHIRKQTQKHLDSYAREGLRTLCIAKKVMFQEGDADVRTAWFELWVSENGFLHFDSSVMKSWTLYSSSTAD